MFRIPKINISTAKIQSFIAALQVVATITIAWYAFVQYKQRNALSYIERFYTGNMAAQQQEIASAKGYAKSLVKDFPKIAGPGDYATYNWAQSILMGREISENINAKMAAFFIFQAYEEISKCYFSNLCDRDTLETFMMDRVRTHHNLLIPLGFHYEFNIQPFMKLLLYLKYCTPRGRSSMKIISYDIVNMGKLQSYQFLNQEERSRIQNYLSPIKYEKPNCAI